MTCLPAHNFIARTVLKPAGGDHDRETTLLEDLVPGIFVVLILRPENHVVDDAHDFRWEMSDAQSC